MFLCIDYGNKRTKAGVFSAEGVLIDKVSLSENVLSGLKNLIAHHQISNAIVSTTGHRDWDINSLDIPVIELSHDAPLPVRILYSTPGTLGRDRIAAACGANFLYPGRNCLIVDAGTCITMDMLLANGIFIGGNISPGIEMRLQAMHEKTARLPKVTPAFPDFEFGDSTEHALQNGACLGAIMEISGIINRAKDAYGDVLIVITGGDAAFLAAKLEYQIFVEPELVLQGLYQILSFHAKNSY